MAFCLRFRLWFEVFLCMFSLSSSFASIFIARFPFAFFCSLLLFRIRMIRFFRCTNQYAIWRLGRIPIYNKFKCEGMKTHALFFYCFIRLLLSMFDCVWRAEWGSVDLVGLNLLLYIAFFSAHLLQSNFIRFIEQFVSLTASLPPTFIFFPLHILFFHCDAAIFRFNGDVLSLLLLFYLIVCRAVFSLSHILFSLPLYLAYWLRVTTSFAFCSAPSVSFFLGCTASRYCMCINCVPNEFMAVLVF